MGQHTTGVASSAAMEDAPLVHQTTLHMKESFIANITMPSSSRRKETTANSRLNGKKIP
ncbi:hypothetical protein Goshw_027217 [Gossypium schwendimanii]|uniref:Uncharacterized protein n=1 Tax=Gossypium schwendimanii TaxID=34291 RepID=A0A7J9KUP4_GOSSC|nr:hypothetical protein [Gossypium schwendimanii]